MNAQEYKAELGRIMLLACVVRDIKIAEILAEIDRAETIGPVLEPTLYLRSMNKLQATKEIVQAALRFQKAAEAQAEKGEGIVMKEITLQESIRMLAEALCGTGEYPALILAARYLMARYDRDLLPDWIAALAGGNPENWDEVRRVTLAEMELEDGNGNSVSETL